MTKKEELTGRKLLLMGSSAFGARELPAEVREEIDGAMARNMTVVVSEAHGTCRAFQDYLQSKGYGNVIVGHAKSLRYNAGDWKARQYGQNLVERERNMIEDYDSAIVIWANKSGAIAENLEQLKRLGKPAFLYECSTKDNQVRAGSTRKGSTTLTTT